MKFITNILLALTDFLIFVMEFLNEFQQKCNSLANIEADFWVNLKLIDMSIVHERFDADESNRRELCA